MVELEHVLPADIEKTSFSIIRKELAEQGRTIPESLAPVILRVIHTTADFEYAETMTFSEGVIEHAQDAILRGAHIITDTNMAYAGIHKASLEKFGGQAHCFMSDQDVAREAKERKVTRSTVCMERGAQIKAPLIFVVGNAPTALISLYEMIQKGFTPELIIGVPVGFVNVVQAKELILETEVPSIINRGRKGGSNVAAAICNALLYSLDHNR